MNDGLFFVPTYYDYGRVKSSLMMIDLRYHTMYICNLTIKKHSKKRMYSH